MKLLGISDRNGHPTQSWHRCASLSFDDERSSGCLLAIDSIHSTTAKAARSTSIVFSPTEHSGLNSGFTMAIDHTGHDLYLTRGDCSLRSRTTGRYRADHIHLSLQTSNERRIVLILVHFALCRVSTIMSENDLEVKSALMLLCN